MKKIISIISIIFVFSFISYADFETGNSLFEKLRYDVQDLSDEELKKDTTNVMGFFSAWGYALGVFDMADGLLYEAPQGVTSGQILDITKKYLNDHPELRHKRATVLLIQAFTDAFPKKDGKNKKGRWK